MTTITLQELGDGSVSIEPTGPAGATDAAKALAALIEAGFLGMPGRSLQPAPPVTWVRRFGTTIDAHGAGRRFVIVVAELPTP